MSMRFFGDDGLQRALNVMGLPGGVVEKAKMTLYFKGSRAAEFAFTQKDVDAHVGETLGGIVVTNVGANAAHPCHDLAEIGADAIGHMHAKVGCFLDFADDFGRANDGFGGYAAGVEAVAAEQMFFDKRHFCAYASCPDCAHQPG